MNSIPKSDPINNRSTYVKHQFKRRDVQRDLKAKGFRAHLLGTNIYILNRLTVAQYQGFLKLLDRIMQHVKANFAVSEGELIPLTLPWPKQWKAVDFDRLLKSKTALEQVFVRCAMPSGKSEVNFNSLPWIYSKYVANISQ